MSSMTDAATQDDRISEVAGVVSNLRIMYESSSQSNENELAHADSEVLSTVVTAIELCLTALEREEPVKAAAHWIKARDHLDEWDYPYETVRKDVNMIMTNTAIACCELSLRNDGEIRRIAPDDLSKWREGDADVYCEALGTEQEYQNQCIALERAAQTTSVAESYGSPDMPGTQTFQDSLTFLCHTRDALRITRDVKKKVGDRLRATGVSRTYVEPE